MGDKQTLKLEGNLLKVEGFVNEDFAPISLPEGGEITVDLDHLEGMNSCGIREWVNWMKEVSKKTTIKLQNCPPIFITQLNMISGIAPSFDSVISFYVPYYCDDDDSTKLVLLTAGKDFEFGSSVGVEDTIEESGKEYELDVLPAKYFKFAQS